MIQFSNTLQSLRWLPLWRTENKDNEEIKDRQSSQSDIIGEALLQNNCQKKAPKGDNSPVNGQINYKMEVRTQPL